MEHAMNLRDAQRLAGRPDVYTVSVGTAESDQAQIAAANPSWGVRPQHLDGRMVSILTEMTTNSSMTNKALHYRTYGNVFGNLAGAIYGGYAGGPEGTLILQTAYSIQGACLYGTNWTLHFPFHLSGSQPPQGNCSGFRAPFHRRWPATPGSYFSTTFLLTPDPAQNRFTMKQRLTLLP